jgi:hypothetical protein
LQPFADGASCRNAATIAAHRTRQIDSQAHLRKSSRTRSMGIASAVPLADRTVVA